MTTVADNPKPTAVYIAYNREGEIIYVGIAKSVRNRIYDHAESSAWWSEVRRIDVEHFSTRAGARARERLLILAYSPPFNVESNYGHTAISVERGNGSLGKASRNKVKLGRK